MKKLLAMLLAVIMVLSLVACGGSGDAPAADQPTQSGEVVQTEGGKTKVTVGVNGTAESLSPFITTTNVLKMIHNIIYMQLGSINEEGGIDSNMYSSFEQVGDMHYVVELYDNIYDNAGNHITAADVAFSYNTAKESGTGQVYTYYENAEATGEYTFEFDMKTDAVFALQQVMNTVNIVSQSAYEADSSQMSMGPTTAGSYVVREFVPGSYIIMEKNPNFWCEDPSILSRDKQANVDVIEIKFITEAAQLSMALEQNTIDVAIEVNATVAADFKAKDTYTVEYKASNLFYNLYFDVREGHLFENEALRKAVLYAIDQESVMYGALQGAGWVNKAIASVYSADYDPAWDEADYYGQDLEKAKQLLEEAGYNGETVRIMCQYEVCKPAAEVVQANLAEIGIEASILVADTALFSSYQDCISDVWDINIMFYAAKSIGAASLNAQFNAAVRENGMTFSGIKDPEFQRLIELAISEKTYSQETYNAVQEYIKEKAYAYGLYTGQVGYVYTSQIEEIYIDGNGRFLPNACIFADNYSIYE